MLRCCDSSIIFQQIANIHNLIQPTFAHLKRPVIMATKKARAQGAGRKRKAPDVRIGLFNWFVDVIETLKVRLPRCIFKMKANQLYKEWLTQNPFPENERLKFSNQCVKE